MLRNKKTHLALTAMALCLLLVAGTFAWTNFSSSIINNFFGAGLGGNPDPVSEPGGTLHNDFEEGKDYRDVYVENWGTEPLIVRIKLSEYMEIGDGAGNQNGADNNQAVSLVNSASIDDPNTWTPFNSDASDSFRYHWNWTMGGQKLYFPAPVELRGTSDENGVEFVSTRSPVGQFDALITIYMQTLDAEVLTMPEWIDRGMPMGHYWVVDSDGYSYWAAPLLPNEATGLLLHKVELNNQPAEDFYYAINVAAHMATIDDEPDNYTKLLLDASEDAAMLVNMVADAIRDEYNEFPVLRFEIESLWRPDVIDFDEFWELEPVIFQSRDEALEFYNANTEVFSARGWTIDFQNVILRNEILHDERFDNAFFNDYALLFVPFRGDLGASFPITNISRRAGALVVEIERTNFGSGSIDDPFPHYYIVRICRSLISDEIQVDIQQGAPRPTPSPFLPFSG